MHNYLDESWNYPYYDHSSNIHPHDRRDYLNFDGFQHQVESQLASVFPLPRIISSRANHHHCIRGERVEMPKEYSNWASLFLLRRMMLVHGGIVRKTALSFIGPWRQRRHCHSSSSARVPWRVQSAAGRGCARMALGLRATTVESTFTRLGDMINKA